MRVAHLKLHHFPTQGVFNKASLITTSTVAIAQVTAAENRGLDVCHPVYHSSKTAKRHSKQQKSPLVYQSSHVYTESTEYTKPRKRRYLARPPSHVPGQWPKPVARGQGWLYVSTSTSMHLAPVRCRVLLHSLLPTDDGCSSSSLSTSVIKFSIYSDSTRKLSALPPELRRIR